MSAPHPEDLIDEYLAGELPPESAAEVRAYLEATPGRRGTMAGIRSAARGKDLGSRPSARVMLEQLIARIEAATRPAFDVAHNTKGTAAVAGPRFPSPKFGVEATSRTLRGWLAAGLVVGGIVATGTIAYRPAGTGPEPHPTRTYVTGTGQQAVLRLDDGSRVTLAPRTTLRVLAFNARARTIALEGEAHFDVRRSAGTPFVVRTGVVDTRVLGTEFVVRRYPEDAGARVIVTSGKVIVSANTPRRPSLTLAAGGAGEVTDSTASATADGGRYADWWRGSLVFNKTPTAEVLATLSRWYGYEFRVTDTALARVRLTAVLSTQSSQEALSTLRALLDVEFAFDRNVVTLTPRRDHRAVKSRREAQHELNPNRSEVGR